MLLHLHTKSDRHRHDGPARDLRFSEKVAVSVFVSPTKALVHRVLGSVVSVLAFGSSFFFRMLFQAFCLRPKVVS